MPECSGDACITCSDQAVEVTVVALLDGEFAEVETGAGRETVSVALVAAGVGDTILVHAGEAIARIDTGEAIAGSNAGDTGSRANADDAGVRLDAGTAS